MKIAMFGQKRIPSREGGVERVVTELSSRMAERGHIVVCYNRGGCSGEYRGVKAKAVPALRGKGLEAVSAGFFAAVCCALGDADVVHIHAEGPAFWSWIPKLAGKRVIVTIHGLDWQREKWKGSFGAKFIRAGEKMAVKFADEIIVLSQNVKRYFLEIYGRETVYLPNGAEPAERRDAEEIGRSGLKKDGFLLYLGRLVPEKGAHFLIEAFQGVRTEKKLVIAGATSDTEAYAERLKEKAKGDRRILFTGFVQGRILEELYSNAYAYVLPSELEGMPLSLLEAMGCGNCCVVSDIPECTEVLEEAGVVVPKGDAAALRVQLQRLCDKPELVEECRTKVSEMVRKKADWEEITERTLEVYGENSDGQ